MADPLDRLHGLLDGGQAITSEEVEAAVAESDVGARSKLATKIARLAAGFDAADRDAVRQRAVEVLEVLVRDQTVRVRQILAETLKDVAHAPPDVIRRLARDAEAAVACPVLEFSPALTDADLLEIIAGDPASDRLGAIAKRPAVAQPVADAVIGTGDATAIGVLLANPDAVIREAMLDHLIEQAPAHESWHQPLVNRPALPARAATKLARFVADNLLNALQERNDLPADVLVEVRREVDKRLGAAAGRTGAKRAAVNPDEALKMAREHHKAGHLDENMIAEAVRTGDKEFAIAALSLKARLPVAAVRKTIAGHDPHGMLAIAWQAGLSVKSAEMLQQRLAAVAPDQVLRAVDEDYPLDRASLEFQIDFIKHLK